MSAFHEIYLRPLAGADLIADVELLLGVRLDREPRSGPTAGTTLEGGMVVEIFDDMALEDDMGMPFAAHPWQIAVISPIKDADAELKVARSLFAGLKVTGRYSLFLTFDAQRLIDSAVVDGGPAG